MGKERVGDLDERAEKEKTDKVPDGDIVQILESDWEGTGWICWRRAESCTYSSISDSIRFLRK